MREQVDRLGLAEYVAMLARLMETDPPIAADAPVMVQFVRIGLMPGRPFDFVGLPAQVQRGLTAAHCAGLERIMARTVTAG